MYYGNREVPRYRDRNRAEDLGLAGHDFLGNDDYPGVCCALGTIDTEKLWNTFVSLTAVPRNTPVYGAGTGSRALASPSDEPSRVGKIHPHDLALGCNSSFWGHSVLSALPSIRSADHSVYGPTRFLRILRSILPNHLLVEQPTYRWRGARARGTQRSYSNPSHSV